MTKIIERSTCISSKSLLTVATIVFMYNWFVTRARRILGWYIGALQILGLFVSEIIGGFILVAIGCACGLAREG